MVLGQRLKELREARQMSQKQLADLVNLSQQTIGHYEVDRAEPSITTLEQLARIFNTTTDYLLGLSASRYPRELTTIDRVAEDLAALPEPAQKEVKDFTEYIKQKYKHTPKPE